MKTTTASTCCPEKKSYQVGETAKFQVRMPFRFATALVAVEREGIIETHVVQLNGQDPTVSLKVQSDWGPNVYVSVLALRGRLREVPGTASSPGASGAGRVVERLLVRGQRNTRPRQRWSDLSKPAFRLGLAEIRVGKEAHQINVKRWRPTRKTTRCAAGPGHHHRHAARRQAPANAEVAVAAVDQALLELMPNASWNLLEAMLQRRSWGVQTSTAQMEIIGTAPLRQEGGACRRRRRPCANA